jgi:hypothetical protein
MNQKMEIERLLKEPSDDSKQLMQKSQFWIEIEEKWFRLNGCSWVFKMFEQRNQTEEKYEYEQSSEPWFPINTAESIFYFCTIIAFWPKL